MQFQYMLKRVSKIIKFALISMVSKHNAIISFHLGAIHKLCNTVKGGGGWFWCYA